MDIPNKIPQYQHLKEIDSNMPLVYGPVLSRRFGLSLGINPFGNKKACSFDCPYCELGPSTMKMKEIKQSTEFPKVEEIEGELRNYLRHLDPTENKIEAITLSGAGEPLLYPNFLPLSEMLLSVRDELAPGTPLLVLTNGAHIDSRKVVHACNLFNERIVKLDAGKESTFKTINAPLIRANVSRISSASRQLKDVIIQSFFVHGSIDNTTQEDIEEWIEVVGIIQPKMVHIYSLDRIPWKKGLLAPDEDTLYTIASRLKRRTQIESKVFS